MHLTVVPVGHLLHLSLRVSTVWREKKIKCLDITHPTRIGVSGTFLLAPHGVAARPEQATDNLVFTYALESMSDHH